MSQQNDPPRSPSKAHVNPGSPPPINWATKPKRTLNIPADHLQDHTDGAGTNSPQLVPVLVDSEDVGPPAPFEPMPQPKDNKIVEMRNLRALLRHLGHSSAAGHSLHEDICLDGRDSTPDVQDLTSAFSGLSTSTNSSPGRSLTARTTPAVSALLNPSVPASSSFRRFPVPRIAPVMLGSTSHALSPPIGVRTVPGSAAYGSPKKLKYYVVVVGKCTGIYYDEWENVQRLIHQVPGALHKSFSTYELAEQHYLDAKSRNKVRIVRNPGDDEVYGPKELAIQ